MEKKEFTYQRFILRFGLSILILPIVEIIRSAIFSLLEISDGQHMFFEVAVILGGMMLYYRWTMNLPFFLKRGYYWEENETVYIQRGKKVEMLSNVSWLSGTDIFSYYGRTPMLIVNCKKKRTIVYAKTVVEDTDFSSTELYPICRLVLKNNPQLQEDNDLPYWYEVKKEC